MYADDNPLEGVWITTVGYAGVREVLYTNREANDIELTEYNITRCIRESFDGRDEVRNGVLQYISERRYTFYGPNWLWWAAYDN